jgi:Protein of unknown function
MGTEQPMLNNEEGYADRLILSLVTPDWQKVAMIIAKALRASKDESVQIRHGLFAARIVELCRQGCLESQGNLSNWRGSEVRLPKPMAAADSTEAPSQCAWRGDEGHVT